MFKSFSRTTSDLLAIVCMLVVGLVISLVGLIYLGPKAVVMGFKLIREFYGEITKV